MAPDFEKAISLIDAAHAKDPNITTKSTDRSPPASTTGKPTPYELYYAHRMTSFLQLHTPNPSQLLSLAVRAQHLRRWEVPRSSYPDGKAGYLAWRAFLKKRQAEQARDICLRSGFSVPDADRVASLINKEGLLKKKKKKKKKIGREGQGGGCGGGGGDDDEEEEDDDDDEVQVLEDVACLVFLDDQFEDFEKGRRDDQDKIVAILKKTWAKMSDRGRELALQIHMTDRTRMLVGKAVGE